MMGDDTDDVARRAYIGVTRGTAVKADESKKLGELTIRDWFGDVRSSVEHWTPFGYTYVPLPPTGDQAAEVLVAYLGGSPDHPVVLSTADRRHRPKNLKPGELAHHDDQKQITKIGRDGIETTGKKVTITGGGNNPRPDTKDHELNEQLKGLAARLAQAENQVHALFHVTSRLRELTQIRVPEVAALAAILNKEVSGLEAMLTDLSGDKAQALLQKTVEQALQKFLSPNIAGLASVLSGGVEGAIQSLKGQIAGLIASNPIVGQVDQIREELSALSGSGGPAAIVEAKAQELGGQLAQLVSNPVVVAVDQLRGTLQGLLDQAGPGLNFLEPQKRLVQGFTRSMRFGGPG